MLLPSTINILFNAIFFVTASHLAVKRKQISLINIIRNGCKVLFLLEIMIYESIPLLSPNTTFNFRLRTYQLHLVFLDYKCRPDSH